MITKISEHLNMDFLIITYMYTAHSIKIFLYFQVFNLHYLWLLSSLGIDMLCKHIICTRRIVWIFFCWHSQLCIFIYNPLYSDISIFQGLLFKLPLVSIFLRNWFVVYETYSLHFLLLPLLTFVRTDIRTVINLTVLHVMW